MKKFTKMLLVVIFMFITASAFTQTVKTEVYTNYGYGIDSSFSPTQQLFKGDSKFNVKDVFLGIDYKYDLNFSANAKIRYNETQKVDLYTASIDYATTLSKDLDLNLALGRTESFWYNYTNSLWNNYAIDNVLSEKFNFVDRTKNGLVATLVNKKVTGSLEISNGINGKNNFSAVVSPIENLKIGGFFNNYKNSDTVTNSNVFGGSLFYKFITKKSGSINLYAEYIQLTSDSLKLKEGYTVFGEYFLNDSPFSLLAKFDNFIQFGSYQAQFITGGINYSPNTKFKFGINWRNSSYSLPFANIVTTTKSHNEIDFTAGFNL